MLEEKRVSRSYPERHVEFPPIKGECLKKREGAIKEANTPLNAKRTKM